MEKEGGVFSRKFGSPSAGAYEQQMSFAGKTMKRGTSNREKKRKKKDKRGEIKRKLKLKGSNIYKSIKESRKKRSYEIDISIKREGINYHCRTGRKKYCFSNRNDPRVSSNTHVGLSEA
jgi:hypothetical protein